MLIKKLTNLGLKELNYHMRIGKNTLNYMVLSLKTNEPLIIFLELKLKTVPFIIAANYGIELLDSDKITFRLIPQKRRTKY